MSNELENQQASDFVEEDVNTTPPNPSSGWKMPEPVFRKTSGYLPQGFEKKFNLEKVVQDSPDKVEIEPMQAASDPDPIPVEPQPDIAEQVDFGAVAESEATVATQKKGSIGRILLIILGLLGAFALVLIFLAVIYYLFFMPELNTTF